MSHDKIKAAARKRMAETGEPYATARREVIGKQVKVLGHAEAQHAAHGITARHEQSRC